MLSEGVPLLEGLKALQSGRRSAGGPAAHLHAEISRGCSFAEALETISPPVPSEDVALAKAGETAGCLPEMLRAITELMERRQERARRYLPRMLYLVAVVGGSLAAAVGFAIARDGGLPLGVGFFGLGALFCLFVLRNAKVGGDFDFRIPGWRRLAKSTPWFGRVLADLDTGCSLATAGRLMGAGLPLSQAVRLSGETTSSEATRAEWQQAGQRLEAKESAADSFSGFRVFARRPELWSRLAAAERAGAFDRGLRTVSDELVRECERRMDRGLTAFQGALLLLAGVVVFLFGYSVIVAPLCELLE